MRCRPSPTADVPSHTSGAAMCHTTGRHTPHRSNRQLLSITSRPGRATSVARKTHRSLAQIPLHSHEVASQERSQDQVNDDRRPQKDAGPTTCETEISKVQGDNCAVRQHADQRRTGPACDPQSNQAIPATRATGIAMPANCSPNSNCPTNDGTISSANPVAASATAAIVSTFLIVPPSKL
jgi:hypothetical protein